MPPTTFARCPECGKLIELDCRDCPQCGKHLFERQVVESAAIFAINAWALRLASAILAFDAFRWMNLVVTAILIQLSRSAPEIHQLTHYGFIAFALFCTGTPTLFSIFWYARFSRFPHGDEKFLRTRRQISLRVISWVAVSFVQVAVLALQFV